MYCCLILQNSPRGLQIFTVNATDRDIGLNANIRFSLDDQSTDLPFELVVDTIRVNGPLDFEQRVIYSVSYLSSCSQPRGCDRSPPLFSWWW